MKTKLNKTGKTKLNNTESDEPFERNKLYVPLDKGLSRLPFTQKIIGSNPIRNTY